MNKFRSAGIALLALSMGIGSSAIAQDRDNDRWQRDRQNDRQSERQNDRQNDRRGPPDRAEGGRHDGANRWEGRDSRHDGYRDGHRGGSPSYRDHDGPRGGAVYSQRGEWRGAGPNHQFYRGGRLPPQYRGGHYVVSDWRAHRLNPPPYGHHWVQTGGDYVLAAIATGVILQILLNN